MSPASSHQFRNLVGTNIANDRFELLSVLGLGAYGVVYLARDREHALQKQPFPSTSAQQNIPAMQMAHQFGSAASGLYAIKCLNKVGLDERQREFQRREIELHAKASQHKSIVTLHQVIDSAEDPYIFVILDYCPDGDLFSMITERQTATATRRTANGSIGRRSHEEGPSQQQSSEMDLLIKSVFDQILDAVEYCHQHQIYHRDLKPENILCLDGGRRVVLADFGLATQEPTSSDFGCGSTFYMGPECQGGLLRRISKYSTPANDVWSLGVILVNLVCGRNPWRQACVSDRTFMEYVRNPHVLKDILPISEDTNTILRRIFTMEAQDRCSITELRRMVSSVRTFTAFAPEILHRRGLAKLRAIRERQQQDEVYARAQARAKAYAHVAAMTDIPAGLYAPSTRVCPSSTLEEGRNSGTSSHSSENDDAKQRQRDGDSPMSDPEDEEEYLDTGMTSDSDSSWISRSSNSSRRGSDCDECTRTPDGIEYQDPPAKVEQYMALMKAAANTAHQQLSVDAALLMGINNKDQTHYHQHIRHPQHQATPIHGY
ncbi:hypothetical protein CF327_g2531 [Tilletia walkeri]|nr:hypothetical protein CF327_g2531 [Tilletia walkeri]